MRTLTQAKIYPEPILDLDFGWIIPLLGENWEGTAGDDFYSATDFSDTATGHAGDDILFMKNGHDAV